jgi:predicted GIY-YIG superfamily endonuclease
MHIVYQIIWPATRNVYYGLTKDLCRRLAKHCRFAVNGDNAPLYAAMRLDSSYQVDVLHRYAIRRHAAECERRYIRRAFARGRCLNRV